MGLTHYLLQLQSVALLRIFLQSSAVIRKMARTDDGLKVLPPQAEADERTPLLAPDEQDQNFDGTLEAQAIQEQREHDANAVPIADEPSTARLIMVMSAMW